MSHSMTTPGVAGWIEHSGPDAAAAKRFYSDVLGWTIADIPMKDGAGYSGIMISESPIGGFSPFPSDHGAWTIYITVEDVDARLAKAQAAGAKLLHGPMDVPGVGRMATIADPQGAHIAMITYESMGG